MRLGFVKDKAHLGGGVDTLGLARHAMNILRGDPRFTAVVELGPGRGGNL